MSHTAAFLWGALGGAVVQLVRGQASVRRLPLLALVVVVSAAIGGVVALLVLDGSRHVNAAAAVLIGAGYAAVVPLVVAAERLPLSPAAAQREGDLRRFAHWWNAARAQTLLAFGMFVLALLTFVFRK